MKSPMISAAVVAVAPHGQPCRTSTMVVTAHRRQRPIRSLADVTVTSATIRRSAAAGLPNCCVTWCARDPQKVVRGRCRACSCGTGRRRPSSRRRCPRESKRGAARIPAAVGDRSHRTLAPRRLSAWAHRRRDDLHAHGDGASRPYASVGGGRATRRPGQHSGPHGLPGGTGHRRERVMRVDRRGRYARLRGDPTRVAVLGTIATGTAPQRQRTPVRALGGIGRPGVADDRLGRHDDAFPPTAPASYRTSRRAGTYASRQRRWTTELRARPASTTRFRLSFAPRLSRRP
jgi:hypothetical protein